MSSLPSRLRALARRVRRRVLARRRLLAAVLLAVGVAAGLRAVAPPPAATVTVLTAARDLPSGITLTGADLREVAFAEGTSPDGLAADVLGRTLAAPLRRGEPVTDLRLVGEDLLGGYPRLTALPIRIPDAGVAGLLRVGDRIDLIAADPQGATARTLATRVPVLALPRDAPQATGQPLPGALVVVGVETYEVEEVSLAAATQFLAVSWSR